VETIMRKLLLALAALLLPALPAAAGGTPVRTLSQRFPAADAARIELEFPVGEVLVSAHDGRDLLVDVTLECERAKSRACLDAARQVRLAGTASERKVRVELEEWPRMGSRGLSASARVQMPRALPLSCDLGVGSLHISGLQGDLDLDVGVGEVNVTMLESAVRVVDLDVGVGDADLTTPHGRQEGRGWIAKELHWKKGPGDATIQIDCGVGEIRVALH
jgi:hypothetical protein